MSIAPADSVIRDEEIIVYGGETKITSFFDYPFKDELLDGIASMHYEKPSKIQEFAIPILLKGKDLVMQSQSGSGKTMAFLLSALQKIDYTTPQCQVVIILNTRELTRQTADVFDLLTEQIETATRLICLPGYEIQDTCAQFYIGTALSVQKAMMQGMEEQKFNPNDVKFFIVDEADAILDDTPMDATTMTPYTCLKNIKQILPTTVQTILVSATHPQNMARLEKYFVKSDHATILINQDEVPKSIRQLFVVSPLNQRAQNLLEVVKVLSRVNPSQNSVDVLEMGVGQAIIFVNRKEEAVMLCQFLNTNGIPSGILMSGDNTMRDDMIDAFRGFKIRYLITTDVIARGIDILTVNFVVNFSIPVSYPTKCFDVTTYIHRVGRTGRIGMKGIALSFLDPSQKKEFVDKTRQNMFEVDEFSMSLVDQIPKFLLANEQHNKEIRDKYGEENLTF
ncbi:ATP-dependent RNA helicase dbp5, putative [Entamoeba invadens IP1]|uniref:ATP-dependent RNA helicase n=1 Tax=Entamoeba invadens IP1 TaxID=370355 RepID=A0A0A1TZB2_ENTIV|nr:ATP-dependent RNA helicase dbp5, putative [Entamoeba invadens IP1]ELP86894.1 ATP-dependent RNA helicase dbp5, putative [Entamoeba invadens IP1]|eukprot:XP_004253665.1 ATP-dependent RNA helicase dbp5, putative [Entamoeba invadens IP1]